MRKTKEIKNNIIYLHKDTLKQQATCLNDLDEQRQKLLDILEEYPILFLNLINTKLASDFLDKYFPKR